MICTRGIWDSTVPGIKFYEDGSSNYAKMFDELCKVYPRGIKGKEYWQNLIEKIKKKGKSKKYDCIIGVSGGTDSSYLLYVAKIIYGLRPLAVNLDNGWSSKIAVQNIKNVTKALDIDLETYVINYEEVIAVLRAYIKSSLPWIDGPTDLAINSALYKIAKREGIKYILIGSDFRSEGKQPIEWTHSDAKQLSYIVNKYEKKKLKSFPYQTIYNTIYLSIIKKIRIIYPYYYIDYEKKTAMDYLSKNFNWVYYGGHHHENIFTRFTIGYWLPKKFGIDKRIITLSAQVLSGEITRVQAFDILINHLYSLDEMEKDKKYVLKKLNISEEEFAEIWKSENKYYWDYPSYVPIVKRYSRISRFLAKKILFFTPTMFIEKENR